MFKRRNRHRSTTSVITGLTEMMDRVEELDLDKPTTLVLTQCHVEEQNKWWSQRVDMDIERLRKVSRGRRVSERLYM